MYAGGAKQIVSGQGLAMLREVRAAVGIPIVAIGGITEPTVSELLAAGADAVAIISDVVYAKRCSRQDKAATGAQRRGLIRPPIEHFLCEAIEPSQRPVKTGDS
jgi:thiamine monophosphate synthase